MLPTNVTTKRWLTTVVLAELATVVATVAATLTSASVTVAFRRVIVCPLQVKLYSTPTTAFRQTRVGASKDGTGGMLNPLSKAQRTGGDSTVDQSTGLLGQT